MLLTVESCKKRNQKGNISGSTKRLYNFINQELLKLSMYLLPTIITKYNTRTTKADMLHQSIKKFPLSANKKITLLKDLLYTSFIVSHIPVKESDSQKSITKI